MHVHSQRGPFHLHHLEGRAASRNLTITTLHCSPTCLLNEQNSSSIFVKHLLYLGEFGCVNRATVREQAFQQYYLKYYAKLAKTYGVPALIWDNGASGAGRERHAFIDHGTGEFCSSAAEAAINAMVDSYNNDLTLEQVYNNAPK